MMRTVNVILTFALLSWSGASWNGIWVGRQLHQIVRVRFLSFRRIRPRMRRKEPSVAKGNLPAGIHRNISTIAGKSSLAAPRSRPLYARHFRQSSERASTLTGWASYSSSSFSPFWCLIERSRKPGLSKETVREKRHRNKRHNNPALLLQFDLINQGPYVYNAIQFMLCELWYI
jgi:hypothetical protein